jgi:iron(III) transport system substrate-binding protein
MSPKISRRGLAASLGVLATAPLLPSSARADIAALEDAARREGTLTWYTAHTDGAVLMVSPSAVLANAPHPNAAQLFMEFLLGEEHARISVKMRNELLRPEVKPLAGARPFTEVNVIRLSTAEIEKGIPKVIEQWRDTFGN